MKALTFLGKITFESSEKSFIMHKETISYFLSEASSAFEVNAMISIKETLFQ